MRHDGPAWLRFWWLPALWLLLALVLLPRPAAASRPVIVPDREAEVLALVEPHVLGDELAPGWTLHSMAIDVGTIRFWIAGPDETFALVTLDHPDYGPPDARLLPGFALKVAESPPGSEAAVARVVEAIERNDSGEFWKVDVTYADEGRAYPFGGRWTARVRAWASDGIVLLGLFCVTLLAFVANKLREAEPWMKWTLAGIVVVGAILRLTLPQAVAMAPWPYTRFLISARLIYEGPALASLQEGPVWMSEVSTASTLALSVLAPLAVYLHARYLLDDPRGALIAAGIVAVLPLHLRFSQSDAAFIPSITVSSTVFALVHAATREPRKGFAFAAMVLFAFPLALMFLVRPLNIMYYPLLVATPFVNEGLRSDKARPPRGRVILLFGIVSAVTFGLGVRWLLAEFGAQVEDGLRWETIKGAAEVMFSPRMNALLNPAFTPPLLTLLAIYGAVDLWRRGKKLLFAFIVSWLLGFLVAHAYVVPVSPYMQARYHLHLVVPYVLLVVAGFDAALRWLADRRDKLPALAGRRYQAVIAAMILITAASPLIHIRFIRTIDFNDTREWVFVHSLRGEIPGGCTIIEYGGEGADARFDRVGAWIHDGVPRSRWRVLEMPQPEPGDPEIPQEVREVLEDPPECLYWYEGLPCFGHKPEGQEKAAACDAIVGFVELEEVAATEFDSVIYDETLNVGLGDAERVRYTLYRAHRREE